MERYALIDSEGRVVNIILADESFEPSAGLTKRLASAADEAEHAANSQELSAA